MLRSLSSFALAALTAFVAACNGGGGGDAGERPDIVISDVVPYDRPPPLETGTRDVTDVATQVDVQPYDGAMDAGSPQGDAASIDGAAGDSGAFQCMLLADEYARAVVAAESCADSGDCTSIVCETLCCACQVYVNPGSRDYPTLARLASQWQSLHCDGAGLCTEAIACDPPASAACTSQSRCATVRAPSPG